MSDETKVIMNADAADATARRYVCAGCWGPITVWYLGKGQSRVACVRCGDGRGFVTKRYAARRRDENIAEALDVKAMMRNIGLAQKRTAEQVLKEMGV